MEEGDVTAAIVFAEIMADCQLEGDYGRMNLKRGTNKCEKWIVSEDTVCATLQIFLLMPLLRSPGLCTLISFAWMQLDGDDPYAWPLIYQMLECPGTTPWESDPCSGMCNSHI